MENNKSNKRVVAGIMLLIFGAILFAQNFGLIDIAITEYIFHWQSILIFIGIFVIAGKPRRLTGYILTMIGVIFWVPEFFNVEAQQIIWPAMLIGVGTLVLFKGWFYHKHPEMKHAFAHCKDFKHEMKFNRREH
jgi:hypothetical protein